MAKFSMFRFISGNAIRHYVWALVFLGWVSTLLFPVSCSARSKVISDAEHSAYIRQLIKAGKLDEAYSLLKYVGPIHPGNEYLHHAGYEYYMARKIYSKALSEINDCLNFKPDRWYFYLCKARAECGLRQYKTAISTLSKAIAVQDDIPALFYERGRCAGLFLLEEKTLQADLNKAAILYLEQGDSEQALSCVELKRMLYRRLIQLRKLPTVIN
ncbi:MAG: hypothetical protein K2W82_12730 [Candidatus Obscuribacterales bacterium]|nr:hypothetical protein [Candidatus Obscuribacterales bacterium]